MKKIPKAKKCNPYFLCWLLNRFAVEMLKDEEMKKKILEYLKKEGTKE